MRCCLLLPFFLLAPALVAQDEPTPPAAKAMPASTPAEPTVSLSFGGGTMATFVAKLRGANPKANILVAKDAEDARLPAIELRDTSLDQALDAAAAVASGDWQIHVKEFRGKGTAPVYSILAAPTGRSPVVPMRTSGTEVFQLERLIEGEAGVPGYLSQTILSAIEIGASDLGVPTMRFHRETALLFVTGGPEQIGVVREVLRNLEKALDDRVKQAKRQAAGKPGAPPPPAEKGTASPSEGNR